MSRRNGAALRREDKLSTFALSPSLLRRPLSNGSVKSALIVADLSPFFFQV